MRLLCSDSHDPFFNLALEDVLLDRGDDVAPLLLFYANDPCVVIGKNQVPWRECATGRLRADGVPMARRISGGGTVYHDGGNLNYSFILPRDAYKQCDVFSVVLRALQSLGIEAGLGAGNGLFIGDRKFSGSAFCYRRQHVLHHGTLLVNANLDALRKYCIPSLPQLVTRAIASKPASVLNLGDVRPGLTTDQLAGAIANVAGATGKLVFDREIVLHRAEELRGWEFLWGHTPKFEIQIADFKLQVERGVIAASDLPELVGVHFDREAFDRRKVPMIGTNADAFSQALEVLDF